MTTSPNLVALTRRRFATPRSAAVVIVMLTLLASFLIAAMPRLLQDVLHDEIAFQVDQLSEASRDLTATSVGIPATFGPNSDPSVTNGWVPGSPELFGAIAQRLAEIRADASPSVQAVTSPGRFVVYTEPIHVAIDPRPADAPEALFLVQTIADPLMQERLALVEGAWPTSWNEQVETRNIFARMDAPEAGGDVAPEELAAPIEIVLTSEVAADMHWAVGEQRSSLVAFREGGGIKFWFRLAGIADAVDTSAPEWRNAPLASLDSFLYDDGDRPPRVTGGAYVDPGSWARIRALTSMISASDVSAFFPRPLRAELAAWYPVSAAATLQEQPNDLLAGLRQLTGQAVSLGGVADAGGDVRVRFESQVTPVLSMSIRRADATTMTLAVAAIGPVAVSIALIVLAAGLIIRRRRGDLLLMSARGTSLSRLRRLLFGEGLLLGVIPAGIGAGAALALTHRNAGIAPTLLALAVGLIPAFALAFVLRPSTLDRERSDIDAPVRSRWSRLLEVLVLILAALAVGLLIFRGVGQATMGVDPLLIVAPLLATVALGLLAVRLHPLWLRAVLHRAQRGTKLVPLVGSARSLRDPAAGTTAVLAMLVAVAIAVFSSLVLATVDRGAVTAAERQVGGHIALAGPVFSGEQIETIRAIDGVSHVAGIFTAGRETFAAGSARVTAPLLVTDVNELAAVQSGFTDGFPNALTPGVQPPQVLVSTEVAVETGIGIDVDMLGGARIVGQVPLLAGDSTGSEFAVIDVADFTEATGRGFFPRKLVISMERGADAAAITAEIRAAIEGAYSVQNLENRTMAIQSSPAVSALRIALIGALVLAVVLSIVAILLVAGVSRDARSRVVALLRTMGMSKPSGRRIIAWEFIPLGISALIGGLVLGAVLPMLVLRSIDLRPFTGGSTQPGLTIDPTLTAGLMVAVVLALVFAVIGGVLSARTTSLVTVLRSEEGQ